MPRRKKKVQEPSKTAFQVRSLILTTFENRMGETLVKFISEGWQLMADPTFVYMGTPEGINPYWQDIGRQGVPHFLVLLRKDEKIDAHAHDVANGSR